jgi:hypothetical protein
MTIGISSTGHLAGIAVSATVSELGMFASGERSGAGHSDCYRYAWRDRTGAEPEPEATMSRRFFGRIPCDRVPYSRIGMLTHHAA